MFIGSSFRLLVAVTGHTSTPDTRQLFGRAIEHLTTRSPRNYTPIPDSPWHVVDMHLKEDVELLLRQQVIMHQRRSFKRLIVFRRIIKTSNHERVVEVRNLRHQAEITEAKQQLSLEGVSVTVEDPAASEWQSDYRDRVVWRLKVPSPTWEVPTSIRLSQGHVRLSPAPLCDLCHSDDHHKSRCIWRDILVLSL